MERSRRSPARSKDAVIMAAALVVAGCLSPRHATRDADSVAYDIVKEKQQAALGRNEPFTIARPEEELRRRLMLDQKLPAAGAASFGRQYLPPVPKEPAGVSANLMLPEGAVVLGTHQARVKGVGRETWSTDIFLVDIGTNPGSGSVPSGAPDSALLIGPPSPEAAPEPLVLSLIEALQVAAKYSRDYQDQKENVFLAALSLDLERDAFEFRFNGAVDAEIASELEGDDTTGVVVSPVLGVDKLFKSGARMTTRIGIDIAKLLTGNEGSATGAFADASITIPLLQGSGVEVVTEGLQQAEREAIYAIWDFETFKRDFAVQIVSDYLDVLGDLQNIENSEANYRSSREAAVLASALYREGRLPGIQVSQATQNALQAQERLLLARQQYQSRLDNFKVQLGLPPDAHVQLDPAELEGLLPLAQEVLGPDSASLQSLQRRVEQADTRPTTGTRPVGPDTQPEAAEGTTQPVPADPTALPSGLLGTDDAAHAAETVRYEELTRRGIRVALQRRLDLAIAYGSVVDAQRQTVLAADGLKAGLDLTAGASYGGGQSAFSGDQADVDLLFNEGSYNAGLSFELPIERTAERNSYRSSLIALDRAIRSAQEREDRVKLDVINSLRDLRVSAEDLRIQAVSIEVAHRQVNAARRFLELGRGEVRDLTEAQDDLINAQNSFVSALVGYRVAQLELQRDLGVLEVNADGLFEESDLLEALP